MLQQGRVRGILDGAASLAIIAASIIVAWATMSRPVESHRPAPNELHVGDQLDQTAGLDLTRAPQSLLLYVRSSCSYCTASMPFYTRLAKETNGKVPLVVVGEEPVPALERYVSQNGFKPDYVVSVRLGALKVTRSPTLVLARSDGRVEQVWQGQLDSGGERDVMSRLK